MPPFWKRALERVILKGLLSKQKELLANLKGLPSNLKGLLTN